MLPLMAVTRFCSILHVVTTHKRLFLAKQCGESHFRNMPWWGRYKHKHWLERPWPAPVPVEPYVCTVQWCADRLTYKTKSKFLIVSRNVIAFPQKQWHDCGAKCVPTNQICGVIKLRSVCEVSQKYEYRSSLKIWLSADTVQPIDRSIPNCDCWWYNLFCMHCVYCWWRVVIQIATLLI